MGKTSIEAVLRAAQETPWAILPAKLAEIRAFLVARSEGFEAHVIEPHEAPAPQRLGSVAVIPVYGTIAPRMNMMMRFSGGTSSEIVAAQIRQAITDPNVSSIVLDIDSPGGTVSGVPELGEEIRRARSSKPIVASVNAIAASAAYWIASQASEIAVTPSGEVGSIGVFMLHEDYSEADKMAGIKTTLITAGKYKAEANPFEPLSEETREHLQKQVDEYRQMFLDAVAAGRSMTVTRVRREFGEYSEGRMALARTAKQLGMVDRIEPRDRTIARMLRRDGRTGSARADIETVRDLESFLFDEGFSRSEARQLASVGRDALALRDAEGDDPGMRLRDAGVGVAADDDPEDVNLRDAGELFERALFHRRK